MRAVYSHGWLDGGREWCAEAQNVSVASSSTVLVEQEVSVRTVESVKFGRLDRARLKEVP